MAESKAEFKCEACGDIATDISSGFKSVRHEHLSASGIQKKFYLECNVKSVANGEDVRACEKCKIRLSSGMSFGGNIESV